MGFIRNLLDLINETFPSIHKEGHKFIFIFSGVSVVLYAIWPPFGVLGFAATLWCIYFFRDPDRVVPDGDNFIVSPADGVVQKIEKVSPPEEFELEGKKISRVSIFLNVFNVHVNRVPIAGKIEKIIYNEGKFLSANLDKASDENERNSIVIKTKDNLKLAFVQIAGLVARRIICDVEEKQEVATGQRYGIIRFGSRVDIYLPDGVNPLVAEGQIAIGGETIIADLKSKTKVIKGNKV